MCMLTGVCHGFCSNIMFYAVLGSLGVLGILALLATGRVSPQNLKGLLIALSNAFGLIAGAAPHFLQPCSGCDAPIK